VPPDLGDTIISPWWRLVLSFITSQELSGDVLKLLLDQGRPRVSSNSFLRRAARGGWVYSLALLLRSLHLLQGLLLQFLQYSLAYITPLLMKFELDVGDGRTLIH